MRRGFLFFAFCVASFFYGWDRGITDGGIGRYIERTPTFYRGDLVLFVLGSFHEVVNQNEKALVMYQRLVTLYPDSKYGDDAQFGLASAYERTHDRIKALEQYQVYLKKYPRGRYRVSVANNISLLKGL